MRAACSGGWTSTTPALGLPGGILPRMVGPELSPNLYDLPSLQSIVEQIGGGAFAPSHPAGQPWTPQIPMTRVILPSAPGTEWAPPADGHLDGYATGWGGGFMAFFVVLFWDVSSPTGGGTAYWPRSHLANHRYFLEHPEQNRRLVPLHGACAERWAPGDLGGRSQCGRGGLYDGASWRCNAAPWPHYARQLG